MGLLQLRQRWHKLVRPLLSVNPDLSDEELAKELYVRRDEMEDFINFMQQLREET